MVVLLFGPSSLGSVPTVTTDGVSAITQTTVIFNGTVTTDGGSSITERGFQYNTVAYPDKSASQTGASLGTGAFTKNIISLVAGQTYFVRAYAVNSSGTGYGAWVTFTMLPAIYSVTINGVDRTKDILNQTINITDQITIQQNTLNLQLADIHSLGAPTTDQEIIITLNSGVKLFGGYIVKVTQQTRRGSFIIYYIECIDYVRLLDRNLVNKTYQGMTDKAIITDIVNTYCAGFGITTTNVLLGVTIDQIAFNYLQPSQAIRKICDLTGRNWYIDYNKDVHYFPLLTEATPFNISDSNTFSGGTAFENMKFVQDATQLKNRVYVRGGTELSNPTTYSVKGDGSTRSFLLPDRPHGVTITVNGASKTLGIANIDISGFDFYLNFEEKYIVQDSGGVILSTTDVLAVNYTYDIPILVAVEDSASIIANGAHEFPIFDNTISTSQAARDRASAELGDYANDLVEAQFDTYVDGFRSGQYINVNSTVMGIINENYFVQKVTASSLGAGNYNYTVYLASAKTMGIIRFLIKLLEQANNLVSVSSNEVLDNLLAMTDSVDPNSLTDLLTIDSAGPYRTWCKDSLESTITRARFGLYEWR